MAGDLRFDAGDLDKFAADLADSRKALAREQRKANKDVAALVATSAQGRAASGSKLERHFAAAIKPRSTQEFGRIAVVATGANAGANTAFFGAKRRTGWYAAKRYADSTRQFPEWVGNTWPVGVPGAGPYVINETIATFRPRIDDLYADAYERAFRKAFPGGFS